MPPLFLRWALSGIDLANGEHWRLLTSGFLHLSLFHIAINMFSLYVLGRSLEPALGSSRYAMVYFTALFGGSAAVILFGAPQTYTAGASGAIYGLMGALLIVVVKARVSAAPVLAIIAINIVLSITLPGISILAHLGGLLFGALCTAAFIYLPKRINWTVAAVLLVAAILIGALGVDWLNVDSPIR